MRPINLALQPFRNARFPATVFAAAAVALAALTVWHAVAIRRLLPARTSALHAEVEAIEREIRALRQRERTLRRENPPPSTIARWSLVKDVVDQRAFSWTGLFESLEAVIPEGVRLTSIEPAVKRGQIVVTVTAMVRTREDGWVFVRALEQGGDFTDVFPTSESGDEFQYVMRYRPRERAAGGAGPGPAGVAEPPARDPGPPTADESAP